MTHRLRITAVAAALVGASMPIGATVLAATPVQAAVVDDHGHDHDRDHHDHDRDHHDHDHHDRDHHDWDHHDRDRDYYWYYWD